MTEDEPLVSAAALERLMRVVQAAYGGSYVEAAIFNIYADGDRYAHRNPPITFEHFGQDLERAIRAAATGNGLFKNTLAVSQLSMPPIFKDPQ